MNNILFSTCIIEFILLILLILFYFKKTKVKQLDNNKIKKEDNVLTNFLKLHLESELFKTEKLTENDIKCMFNELKTNGSLQRITKNFIIEPLLLNLNSLYSISNINDTNLIYKELGRFTQSYEMYMSLVPIFKMNFDDFIKSKEKILNDKKGSTKDFDINKIKNEYIELIKEKTKKEGW